MLYQQVRQSFWRRHPWFTGAALLACWLLIHGSYVTVGVLAIVVLLVYVAERRRALATRNAELCARADYEHRLSLAGDPRGTYGRYPPVQSGWFPDPRYPGVLRYFDGSVWTGYTTGQ